MLITATWVAHMVKLVRSLHTTPAVIQLRTGHGGIPLWTALSKDFASADGVHLSMYTMLTNVATCFHCLQTIFSSEFHCRAENIWEIRCFGINNSFLVTLQADSELLEYEYRADAEYPSPEDSLVHSVINAAQIKNSSSFVVSATHLAGNTAQGAGGGIFATSQAGVYLLCSSSNLADTGQSAQGCLRFCKLSIGCDPTMFLADTKALKATSLLPTALRQPNLWPLGNLSCLCHLFPRPPPLSPSSCASDFPHEV